MFYLNVKTCLELSLVHRLEFATQQRSRVLFVAIMFYMAVWRATKGEVLEAAPDIRNEAKDYDKYAVGVYKEKLLIGHIPIEISSLCFHFLNQNVGNKIKAVITGKPHR